MNLFIRNLLQNAARCFAPRNLPFHFLAIAVTYVCVISGLDWWWFTHTRAPLMQAMLFPAVVLGALVPFFLPMGLLVVAMLRRKTSSYSQILQTALVVIQAQLLGGFVSALYKSFTGRIEPPLRAFGELIDNSRAFNFGFWEHGIFWGWPSSHTTIAFSAAIAIVSLYPKRTALVVLCIVYAFYIGFGISTNIHWFSDFAAGSIFGSMVGWVVGSATRVSNGSAKSAVGFGPTTTQ